MKLYIGFMGAGGTGKTTTATLLAEEMRMPLIPSVSRGILTKYFKTEEEQREAPPALVYGCQKEISEAKLKQDRECTANPLGGVCDRTPLDQLTYLIYRCGNSMDEVVYNSWLRRAYEGLANYDRLFFFPLVTFPENDDGLRETAYGYRATIDLIMRQLIQEMGISPIWVPEGSVRKRIDFIKERMGGMN
jgi:predicted ATPase